MAHITLPDGAPGISGPMQAYPETALHLRGLANALSSANLGAKFPPVDAELPHAPA